MMQNKSEFSVVIFAHNISSVIGACIKSVLLSLSNADFHVYILANGCTDSTERVVKSFQEEHTNIHLISISMADKSNAWNYYVHKLASKAALHFFIDGDVEVGLNALSSISKTMETNPVINIVGGVPVVGRDRLGWIERMISFGRVSGGLYALRDNFLQLLRRNNVKLPIGFIGEDFLISALAKDMLSIQGMYMPSSLLQIDKEAGFSFRQLSPMRINDYTLYFRRLVRYRIRDYQLHMLFEYAKKHHFHAIPVSVEQMYKETVVLPHYYWRGRYTVFDWLAVLIIRKCAEKAEP